MDYKKLYILSESLFSQDKNGCFSSCSWSSLEPSHTFSSLSRLTFVLHMPHQFSVDRLKAKQLRFFFNLWNWTCFKLLTIKTLCVSFTHCIIWAFSFISIICSEEYYEPNHGTEGFQSSRWAFGIWDQTLGYRVLGSWGVTGGFFPPVWWGAIASKQQVKPFILEKIYGQSIWSQKSRDEFQEGYKRPDGPAEVCQNFRGPRTAKPTNGLRSLSYMDNTKARSPGYLAKKYVSRIRKKWDFLSNCFLIYWLDFVILASAAFCSFAHLLIDCTGSVWIVFDFYWLPSFLYIITYWVTDKTWALI